LRVLLRQNRRDHDRGKERKRDHAELQRWQTHGTPSLTAVIANLIPPFGNFAPLETTVSARTVFTVPAA
jgi:hypothetical protein